MYINIKCFKLIVIQNRILWKSININLSCLKTHAIDFSMSAGLLTVFAGLSMPFGRWEDFRNWGGGCAATSTNTCWVVPQGLHMSNPQMLESFRQHPPSPSPQCCTRGSRYATSPQSDAEGSLRGEAFGGRLLQAQMAELSDDELLIQKEWKMHSVLFPPFISSSSYLACFLFSVMKQEIRTVIYETMLKLLFDGCGTWCRCRTLFFALSLYTGHN